MQYFEDVCDTMKRPDLIRIMGREKENFILKTQKPFQYNHNVSQNQGKRCQSRYRRHGEQESRLENEPPIAQCDYITKYTEQMKQTGLGRWLSGQSGGKSAEYHHWSVFKKYMHKDFRATKLLVKQERDWKTPF